jgi:hypothetical protein
MVDSARRVAALAALAALVIAVPLATASSGTTKAKTKPKIKTEEAGYFGNGLQTRTVSVIVYSNLGPRAGNRVTVCLKGNTCKKARGHDANLAWYRADFDTPTLTMADRVTFTAYASDAAGHTRVTVTKPVLCIKNNGSTPQT